MKETNNPQEQPKEQPKVEGTNNPQLNQSTSYPQGAETNQSGVNPDTPDISSNAESVNVQAYKLYKDGKSLKEVAKTLHVNDHGLWDKIVAGAEELGEEPPTKKRGRKPQPADVLPTKDKPNKSTVSSVLSKDSVVKQVFGIHQILALVTVPEAAISEADADLLGGAIYEVIKDSDLEWLTKYEKYINLAVAAAVVEVPTALRIKAAMAAKKKQPATKVDDDKKADKKDDKTKIVNGIAAGEPMK